MRWPCGPLAVAREAQREGATARDADTVRLWTEPAALDLLAGSPVNALVVPWAEGTTADAEQPRALSALVAAAGARGLSVIGWVAEPADLKQAAAAARAAGLAAIATDSEGAPLDGTNVLRFRKRDVAGLTAASLAPSGFLGDSDAVWPGMRPMQLGRDVDAVSGATARPWLDSNAWYVRLARALASPKAVWLPFEPPEQGWPVTADAYVQALADAEAGGATWLVSLDRSLRAGLAQGSGPARSTWERIGQGLGFFRRHAAWRGHRPVGQIGVVSDFSGPNEFLSHELLNLLARRSALFCAVRSEPPLSSLDGLDGALYFDEEPPATDLAAALHAFVERGGTLIARPGWIVRGSADPGAGNPRFDVYRLGQGRVAVARAAVDDPDRLAEDAELLVSHRHDRVRVYNLGVGQYHYATSADGRSGVLHLLAYPSPYPRMPLTVWFRQPWASARDWRVGAKEALAAARKASDGGVEFHLPPASAYGALELSA